MANAINPVATKRMRSIRTHLADLAADIHSFASALQIKKKGPSGDSIGTANYPAALPLEEAAYILDDIVNSMDADIAEKAAQRPVRESLVPYLSSDDMKALQAAHDLLQSQRTLQYRGEGFETGLTPEDARTLTIRLQSVTQAADFLLKESPVLTIRDPSLRKRMEKFSLQLDSFAKSLELTGNPQANIIRQGSKSLRNIREGQISSDDMSNLSNLYDVLMKTQAKPSINIKAMGELASLLASQFGELTAQTGSPPFQLSANQGRTV